LNLDHKLEVIIKQDNKSFVASCPSFPKCKGLGDTKDVALEKLSQSIGRVIGKMAKSAIQGVLTSDNYTEIIFDATQKVCEQRRIFSLYSGLLPMQRGILFKVSELSSLVPQETTEEEPKNVQNLNLFQTEKETLSQKLNIDVGQLLEKQPSQQAKDGYVFGFPLNFN
jgi:predicted RNase H-like HicB family nuclease